MVDSNIELLNTFRNLPIDYTSRERNAILQDAIDAIPFLNPEWTARDFTDPGITKIELLAIIADVLHFYLDRVSRENFLPTAIHRASVVKLLALIDYQLQGATPSTVDLNFALNSAEGTDVTIPKGTILQSSGGSPILFETESAATISAGQTEIVGVPARQGITASEALVISDQSLFQERGLTGFPIIDNTLRVFINEGAGEVEWIVVDSLFNSEPNDLHVTFEKGANERYTIFFGDNANGKIPNSGATIRAQYRIGGGADTNVGVGSIDIVQGTITDALGSPVTITVTNPLAATGGSNRQSIADAKIQGPRSLRARNRAVTGDDIEFFTNDVPGVEKSKAVNAGFNIVDIFIIPSGGGIPAQALLNSVDQELANRGMLATTYRSKAPTYIPIELTMVVQVLDGRIQAEVETLVRAIATSHFAIAKQQFGQDIRVGDIHALIENLSGVDFTEITRLTLTPQVSLDVWSGDSIFSAITISNTTIAEAWTVQFTSPTAFIVTGSVSGTQIATGIADSLYTSDNAEIIFTITSGGSPNSLDDRASFRVSSIRASIIILDSEFPEEQSGGFVFSFTGGT